MDIKKNTEQTPNVICFGEVLWDNLPSGRQPGGAPMNVAYHLNKCGIRSHVLSRVGNDKNGADLLNVLKDLGLSTQYCQVDSLHKTSTVEVNITTNNEVEYEIVYPVAWDFIELENRFKELTMQMDAFVFGSLSGRRKATKDTLMQLLDLATYRVFDVNLREPYYEKGYISSLLEKTDLLKLNTHELKMITGWYSISDLDEITQIKLLQDKYSIQEIIVTRGAEGASFYNNDRVYHQSAFKIQVKDTIGSGDSFLAAFLSKRLLQADIRECLSFASGLSAFITTQSGACPPYQLSDLTRFISTASGRV